MSITNRRVVSIGLFTLALVGAVGGASTQGGFHKITAAPGVIDEKSQGVHLIADYGTYRLYRIADDALAALPKSAREGVGVRDDMDVIQLDAYRLDARAPVVNVPPSLTAVPSAGGALHLVQFVGPIKQQWLDDLAHAGIRPVQYIESNAYLVFADAAGRQALDALATQGTFVQYSGAYHPFYKLGPTLRDPVSQMAGPDRLVPVTIQIFDHDAKSGTVRRIEEAAISIDSDWEKVLTYQNVRVTVPLSRIAGLAGLPDVTWIGERLPITRNDEKQGQIVAGHLNGPRTGPSAPGYKAFLDGKGFSTDPNAYPVVGLSDDGVGNGTVTNGSNDPTFTKLGDGTTTRLAFVQNCTTNPLGDGLDGHGHINTSIVGGYDVRTGAPFQDVDGYQLGMGMNPYGRMAMTKIFANGGTFSISNCGGTDSGVIASSYGGGARISSNSWGCSGCAGTYDASSQAYDAGTRDALPGTAGNQEYLFVFAAGNSGPGASTVGTPGNGKNMITVAASENDRNGWTDGCAVGPTGADNAMDVIGFSSRGPSPGGRKKPEVIAPGTHIQGTASTDPGYNGTGVCDQFMPTTQTVFAASSGTSHSTPAVAGTASLYYRWLQDHYLTAVPSPALIKAYMMAHTTYLTGVSANDTLPSNAQGYGMPSLEMAFDNAPRYLVDQSVRFDNSGDSFVFHGSVADASKPVRIMMVYTDAPGAVGTSPQVNNLDLQAVVGGSTYNGNVFSGQYSVTGGSPDTANNYEAVFLPAGTTGAITINVNAFNIAGDGVPNVGDATDQDFALVCYNCATCTGAISTDRPSYTCGAAINITLGDSDLTGSGTHVITIRSTTETTPEDVTLTETPANSGVFVGSFPTTAAAPVHGDGSISVTTGDTVTLSYLDVSACGTPNVTIEQTAAIDCLAPAISNVQITNITGNSADVTFDTSEPTNAVAHFGTSPPPAGVASNPTLSTSHSVHLSGLTGCTAWVVSVEATDPTGNSTTDNNGGSYYGFITLADVAPTFAYTGPPVAIPDNTTVTASFSVADTRVVQDVNVKVTNLTHTYDGDLVLTLIAPNGTRVRLINRLGGTGENFTDTVFDDEATTPIASGAPPYTGSFKPDAPLSAIDGIPANGTWTLEVQDAATADTGTLTAWEIQLTFPPEQCPTVGQVTLDKTSYQCSETVQIHVVDFSIVGAGTQPVTIASGAEPGGETVTLTETPANSGSFIGSIPLTTAAASPGNGLLSVADGNTITVTYIDADDGYGGINVPRTDTAIIDCGGPTISNVQAINVAGRSADITWSTNEGSNSEVFYGTAAPPLSTVSAAPLVTGHSLHVSGLAPCTTYLYYVKSTDATNNNTIANNGGAYFSFTTTADSQPVFTYSGAAVPIPDNSAAGATASIAVGDVKEVLDVNVLVTVTHPNVGDLELYLVGPNAVEIPLALHRGGTGDNFTNTLFDDGAATSISAGTAPFTGSFKPESSLSPLNGILSNGTWSLKVKDLVAANTGTITTWQLQLTYPVLACNTPFVQEASHSLADSCSGGGSNSVVDPGEDLSIPLQVANTGSAPVTGAVGTISTSTPDVVILDGTTNYGALGVGGFNSGDGPFLVSIGSTVPCGTLITFQLHVTANEGSWNDSFTVRVGVLPITQTTYPSTDTPKPIPDVRTPPVLSSIVVSSTGPVSDVNVTINISHTFDGDLDIFLIGPNGTRVELTTDNGSTGHDYINTVFDDQAATSITTGTAPFTGSFKPEGLLSTLNGIPANGTWTLEITDDANLDSGTLNSWSLTITNPAGSYQCGSCSLAPPGEATNLMFTSKSSASWSSASGASNYFLYRGEYVDLPNLLNGTVDSCQRASTPGLSMSAIGDPPAGLQWYLVRGWNSGGYGSPGSASAGTRTQNSGGTCP
jgi:subtilisin-like proprotein convertase family protein